MTQWIIGGLLAIALGLVGFVTYDVVMDEYTNEPGVVYDHHNSGSYGVE